MVIFVRFRRDFDGEEVAVPLGIYIDSRCHGDVVLGVVRLSVRIRELEVEAGVCLRRGLGLAFMGFRRYTTASRTPPPPLQWSRRYRYRSELRFRR